MSHWNKVETPPRFRVITDNDYAGDPDGLVQLAHHLLSPSVEIRGIISSHLRPGDDWDLTGDAVAEGVRLVRELAEVMNYQNLPPLVMGSKVPLNNLEEPAISPGAQLIIDEANREDVDTPLYVVCGGSLTSIASAWLMDPTIASKLTVIWIGGAEYPGHRVPPPNAMPIEYNLLEDLIAGQVIFNKSDLNLWQIPRDAYRDCNASTAELILRMKNKSKLGEYLFEQISIAARRNIENSGYFSELYSLGDSPLVLLTALQTGFEPAPSSSQWVDLQRPHIGIDGGYIFGQPSGTVRVFTHLDTRLMFEDMYAKFELNSGNLG
jgi:purine nucleosidase